MTRQDGIIKTEGRITSVIMCGVGGQGVLLASELLARVVATSGYDVKQTEVHGVSQRGGSVHSHVRFGPHVFSPLVRAGKADIIFAMEKLEALRFGHYLTPDGVVLVNEHEILPLSAGEAARSYPHEAVDYLRNKGLRVVALRANQHAAELGNVRAANIVLLGALSQLLDITHVTWEKVLRERIPERLLELNLRAFASGAELAAQLVAA